MKMDGEVVCVCVCGWVYVLRWKRWYFSCMFLSSEIFCCEVRYIFPFCFVQFIAVLCFFDLLTVSQGKSVSVCVLVSRSNMPYTQRTMFFFWHLALKEPKQKYTCFKHLAVVIWFGLVLQQSLRMLVVVPFYYTHAYIHFTPLSPWISNA